MEKKIKEISRRSQTGKPITRDKDYYLNNLDMEKALHTKAISLAERMFTAFIRENNIQVSLNTDDLADQIIKKLEGKIFAHPGSHPGSYPEGAQPTENKKGFSYDDDAPVILKTDKIEIKGDLGKTSKSKDSISDNLDVLEDFSL